jgi:starch-binding outer membrane protein, SusD/RagB family
MIINKIVVMKYNKSLMLFAVIIAALLFTGCHKDLDQFPPNSFSSEEAYKNEAGYKQVLAKVYGSMALTGNIGATGAGDVAGIDEGNSDFLRLFWEVQELSADHAIVAWNGTLDIGLQDIQLHNWRSANPRSKGLYYRSLYIITLCNEFLRQSTPDRLSSRGISGDAAQRIIVMASEARFVRAFQYWVLMDVFGNPAFVTDADGVGAFNPKQISRSDLFKFIETELIAIEGLLPAPKQNEYGRADRAAAWSLLARIYLNAEKVYGVGNKYNDAVTYANKVINSNTYSLQANYNWLFLADNNSNGSQNEFIWTLNYNGVNTKNFGGTTFLVNGSVGGGMSTDFSGLQAWAGIRAKEALPVLFPDFAGTSDRRALFFIGKLQNDEPTQFTDGFGCIKFRNRTSTGGFGSDPDKRFSDIDFPVFRLAEMYLIYAESVVRGATTGNTAQAVTYINNLRRRAYGNTTGDITSTNLTVNFMLDERARELYWELHRRTDLLRHEKYIGGSYLWSWKGGARNGSAVAPHQTILPLPDTEIASNPNIKQNNGY